MTIFHKTSDLLDRARLVETKVSKAVDAAADIVEDLLTLADKLDSMTSRLGKAIESAGDFLDTISDVMRRSPLAQGPFKIVIVLVAALLSAIAAVIKGVGAAVKALGKAIKRSPLRRIEKLAETMEDRIMDYADISGQIRNLLIKLKRLSDKLKQEQEDIEKAIPLLHKTVDSSYLKPIEAELVKLEKIADAIDKAITQIKKDIKSVEDILKELNPLEKLFSEFQDAVSGINEGIKKASGKVKDFIDGIPGIGWLFENLDKAISWALEKLGIKALFSKMAKGVEELPFIKKIKDLKKQLDELAKRLIAEFEKAIKQITDAIAALTKNLMSKNATLAIYARIGLTKFNVESWLPAWLGKLIARVRTFREKLEQEADSDEKKRRLIEEWKRIAEQLKMDKQKGNKAVTEPAVPRFGSSVMIPMQISMAEMDSTLDSIDICLQSEDAWGERATLIEHIEVLDNQLNDAQGMIEQFLGTVDRLDEPYFDALGEDLANLGSDSKEVNAEYLRIFANVNKS